MCRQGPEETRGLMLGVLHLLAPSLDSPSFALMVARELPMDSFTEVDFLALPADGGHLRRRKGEGSSRPVARLPALVPAVSGNVFPPLLLQS